MLVLALSAGLGLLGLVAIATLFSSGASADTPCDGTAFPWIDEAEMVTYSCPARDYVFDPGVDNHLTDEQLTSDKAVTFFGGQDFDQQWLWYAPRTTITVTDDNVNWSSCEFLGRRTEAGELCTVDNGGTLVFSPVQHAFDNDNDGIANSSEPGAEPVQLSALAYGGAFIPTACGNFSQNAPTHNPTPVVRGVKYHDLDRDGRRDTGEPGLGGWTFDLERVTSYVRQTPGLTGHSVTSSSAGANLGEIRFEFTEQRNLGPGIYRLVERPRTGWAATGSTYLEFEVDFGAGDSVIDAGPIGNARTEADVAKVDFDIADDFPTRIDARVPTVLPVQVTLANLGPAEVVRVRDEVTISGPPDCVFDQATRTLEETLRRGDPPTTRRVEFTVTCDDPSFHGFEFVDDLSVITGGVTDPNLANNHRQFEETVPVIAETDLSVAATLDCPSRTDVDTDTDCSVTVEVVNDGFGEIEALVEWTVTGPADCAIVPATSSDVVALVDGGSTTLAAVHTVSCADRSYHPIEVQAGVAPVDQHVLDLVAVNDAASAEDTIEVFEAADLAVLELDLWLTCDEYFAGDPFTCTAVVPVTNLGTAPDVIATTTATLSGGGCVASPDPQSATRTIDVGERAELEFAWTVTCDDPSVLHVLRLDACVEPDADDPHAEDRNPTNDCGRVAAVPIDFKPLSDPNTVNLGRGGRTAVAILSSPSFDPMVEVGTTRTLTFGPTGTEAEAVRCASEGEDANGDGYDRDLVCHFANADLGLSIGDERVYLIGHLVDGTRFIGTEQVRVI